jgi:hypothetical protein
MSRIFLAVAVDRKFKHRIYNFLPYFILWIWKFRFNFHYFIFDIQVSDRHPTVLGANIFLEMAVLSLLG